MAIIGGIMVPHPPLIVAEVGRGAEKEVQKTIDAYEEAAKFVADMKPETIVISSPHSIMYADYIHISPGAEAKGDFGQFRAAQVKIECSYDVDLANAIADLADQSGFPAGTLGERDSELDHGTMLPLYFIRKYYTDAKVVRIGISGLSPEDHYQFGMMIRKAADQLGRRVVYVASGDLSHKLQASGPYGFDPAGPEYDARIMDVMGNARFAELLDFPERLCEKAAECGHRSFIMMAGAMDGLSVDVKCLSHEDVTGVGYGVCTYEVTGEDSSRHFLEQRQEVLRKELQEKRASEDPYVRLARRTIETYIFERKHVRLDQTDLPAEMTNRRAGVFVSLHKNGQLRGCIGTISPCTDSIAEEIISNAISAATRDPRFNPVRPEEVDQLEISVDVLGETEPIDSKEQLDVKRYGVIVTKGHKRGLLLPNLDGVDTVEYQIEIACRKAGLRPNENGIQLERFEVVRHY